MITDERDVILKNGAVPGAVYSKDDSEFDTH